VLREPFDFAARSARLTEEIAGVLARVHERPLRMLDLATGRGSNVRYLSSRLPGPQHWLVVDRDPALLADVPAPVAGAHVDTRCAELGALDDPALFAGRHLVTASALLDLVSEQWLHALAARCRASGAAALFALTYDGRSRCSPEEPEDETIRALMNRHQLQNDKGFGVAAGPDAVVSAARSFAAAGYHVRRDASDWVLPPEAHAMQRELFDGWARAAVEMAPDDAHVIDDWLARRLAHVDANRSRIVVGHEDVAAWLA
ncbi:MAG: class I SAM-dependent methyltransferase, partial [Vicinamibacterales bacterium]